MTIESVTAAEAAVGREDVRSAALLASTNALVIANAEQLEASSELLSAIKGRQKDLTELRQSITKPMDEAKRRVMDTFRPALDRLAEAEGAIKRAVLGYTQEQERKRREAQARLAAEASAERERLAALAESHSEEGHEDLADIVRQNAERVTAPTVEAPAMPTGAVHIRTTWSAEVVDLAGLVKACAEGKAPLNLLVPDMPALNALARTQKERFDIPGVKAVAEQGVTARGSRA